MKIGRFADRLFNFVKLCSASPYSFLCLATSREVIHERQYAEESRGGGMYGKSFLFYLAAAEKTGVDKAA